MSARRRTSDLIILVTAGVATTALTVIAFLIAPVDTSPREPGSSYSTERDGTRAAYLVLKELGHDVTRSFEPIASLDGEPARTILLLANPGEKPSKGDQHALRSFIEEGGSVLAFGPSADLFLPGVTPNAQRRRFQTPELYPAVLPGPLTRATRELSAHRSRAPSVDSVYFPVYGSSDNPAVLSARFGAGQVIWCLDESVVQNEGIRRGANVNFITNASGAPGMRTILWDEYYHGQRRSFWSYLAGTPLIWGGAQMLLVALTLVAASAPRRGPLRPKVLEPRASPLEFIDTMASLYERAGDARAAVEATRDRLRRRLAILCGVSPSTDDDRIAALAATRIGLGAERTRLALAASADALRRGIADSKDAVAIVAELQELTALTTAARRGHSGSRRPEHGARR